MIACESNDNYLASPSFISFALHSTTCLAVPIHGFGFYCIVRKTPKPMAAVKSIMLNLHFWCVVLDLFITVLSVPYAMFPELAGFGLGVIDSPGFFLYMMVSVINAVSTAVFVIFENRWFVLYGESTWWKYARKPVIVASYCLTPLYFIPPQLYIPDQEAARQIVWKRLSCVPELPPKREMFVLSLEGTLSLVTVVVCGLVPSSQISAFFLLIAKNLVAQASATTSQKTAQMQRKLAISLIIQSIASVSLFFIPILFVILSMMFSFHSQIFNNMIFFALSVHGICSTLIMVFVHKPYRDFAISPFRRLFRKVPVILVTASNLSSRSSLE